jgi:hypothetical protein|tara:strand:- start:65 stop:262 length:198 start_codon:yes stop_codon:yes gene_type:complete
MKNKKRKEMTDQEFAKYWSGQLDFVQQSLSDKDVPENVKEILGEWLMDRAKEILPKDKDKEQGNG